jgi:hypothetical protein
MLAVQEIKLAGGLASTHALIKEEVPGVRRLLVHIYAYILGWKKRRLYVYMQGTVCFWKDMNMYT